MSAFSFDLDTGRTIYVARLNQWETYEGLLEGCPTKEMNRGIISEALDYARQLGWHDEPHILAPSETPIDLGRDYPFGTPAALPQVVCVALLRSLSPARDADQDYSLATVVWFQGAFAFPIESGVLQQLQALSWDGIATDGIY